MNLKTVMRHEGLETGCLVIFQDCRQPPTPFQRGCLVSNVQLVLLDDMLSAVDVHVARAICEEALLGLLLDGARRADWGEE